MLPLLQVTQGGETVRAAVPADRLPGRHARQKPPVFLRPRPLLWGPAGRLLMSVQGLPVSRAGLRELAALVVQISQGLVEASQFDLVHYGGRVILLQA